MGYKVGPCPKCHYVPWHNKGYFHCEVCDEKEKAEWDRARPKEREVPPKGGQK